jgi:hypothetical protein
LHVVLKAAAPCIDELSPLNPEASAEILIDWANNTPFKSLARLSDAASNVPGRGKNPVIVSVCSFGMSLGFFSVSIIRNEPCNLVTSSSWINAVKSAENSITGERVFKFTVCFKLH